MRSGDETGSIVEGEGGSGVEGGGRISGDDVNRKDEVCRIRF